MSARNSIAQRHQRTQTPLFVSCPQEHSRLLAFEPLPAAWDSTVTILRTSDPPLPLPPPGCSQSLSIACPQASERARAASVENDLNERLRASAGALDKRDRELRVKDTMLDDQNDSIKKLKQALASATELRTVTEQGLNDTIQDLMVGMTGQGGGGG